MYSTGKKIAVQKGHLEKSTENDALVLHFTMTKSANLIIQLTKHHALKE